MRKLLSITLSVFIITMFAQNAVAQGCVAVRQMGGVNVNAMNATGSYNLSKGDFQVGANYRYFHSWRHYVGTDEQPQRQTTGGGIGPDGKDRGNAVNIYSHALDLNLSYALTNRIQVNATVPYVSNERSQVLRQTTPVKDTFRYGVFAHGLGDIRVGVNYWMFDPAKALKGNLMVGAAIKLNTGRYNVTDDAPQSDGTIKNVVMDQAIQPGDGGVGFSLEVQGFTKLYKNIYGFANGYYLFNPRQSNGVFKSASSPGLEGYNIYACPDQYFARAGFLSSVDKAKKLTVSLAGRLEGIPAYDAFGGDVAYRRPGYVIAIETGISYRTGPHSISLFVPFNIVRNRIQSAADIASQNLQNSKIPDPANYVHVQGDAAFADYSINLGYTYIISAKKKGPAKHAQ
ncbi:MAG TPA: hypothetical protein PLA68_12150 [Panacibacter sp.]|nr:hypothetical protein [Panacibacter sp.]